MSAAGTARERGLERGLTSAAGFLLVVAVAVGLVGQGAYYGNGQRLVGLLVGGAVLLALVAWPPARDDLWRLPVLPALALAGWALLDPVALGRRWPAGSVWCCCWAGSWARCSSAGGSGRRTVNCCWPRSRPWMWWSPSAAGWGSPGGSSGWPGRATGSGGHRLEITCNASDPVDVFVTVTQRVNRGIAAGSGFARFGCTGSGQDVTVRVTASPSGRAFVRDKTAVVEAEIFGCRPNICGSETDSETVRVVR